MPGSTQKIIRDLLRAAPEGLTAKQIGVKIKRDKVVINRTIRNMSDAYIDRWEPYHGGGYAAVWCAADVPDHCPHPEGLDDEWN